LWVIRVMSVADQNPAMSAVAPKAEVKSAIGICLDGPLRVDRTELIWVSRHLYRARNLVERFFNKIKQCRLVATRYHKLAANHLAFIQLASIRLWLRANKSAP